MNNGFPHYTLAVINFAIATAMRILRMNWPVDIFANDEHG